MSYSVEPIEGYAIKRREQPLVKKSRYEFTKVGIVGCGILGQEISRMVSSHGIDVIFIEISEEKIHQAINSISTDLDGMIEKWGMTFSEKRAIMSRIKGTMNYEDLAGANIVIESVKSRSRESSVDLRKRIFREVEKFIDHETIIATNSTTLVITEMSSELEFPQRCVSLHFLSPADKIPMVEIARGLHDQ